MPKKKQLVADPISKVRLLDSNVVVGWVYLWNNGDVRVMWREQEHKAVFYDPVAGNEAEE